MDLHIKLSSSCVGSLSKSSAAALALISRNCLDLLVMLYQTVVFAPFFFGNMPVHPLAQDIASKTKEMAHGTERSKTSSLSCIYTTVRELASSSSVRVAQPCRSRSLFVQSILCIIVARAGFSGGEACFGVERMM